MKRIMIVASDEELSQTLSAAIMAQGSYAISRATTVREAFLLVAQRPFDLVLTPAADLPDVRRALHTLQPDLALAAVLTELEGGQQATAQDLESDIVSAKNPGEDLQRILGSGEEGTAPRPAERSPAATPEPDRALENTVVSAPAVVEPAQPAPLNESDRQIVAILDKFAQKEKIAGSILTSGASLRAFGGTLSDAQAHAITRCVGETWREDSSALLQFVRPPDLASDLLLFSRSAPQSQLLTLAAAPDFNVGRLRRAADALAADLAQLVGSATDDKLPPARVIDTQGSRSKPGRGDSFALIFQPRRPLPTALQAAVSQALQDVAVAAGCELHYQQVGAQAVHIVSSCPVEQGSGWLAHLYKQGVEEHIQKQFGVPAQLWRRGFYAAESDRPLSDVEIKLFTGEGV